jgi:hypothetical protein
MKVKDLLEILDGIPGYLEIGVEMPPNDPNEVMDIDRVEIYQAVNPKVRIVLVP